MQTWEQVVQSYPTLADEIKLTTARSESIVQKRTEIGVRLLQEVCK